MMMVMSGKILREFNSCSKIPLIFSPFLIQILCRLSLCENINNLSILPFALFKTKILINLKLKVERKEKFRRQKLQNLSMESFLWLDKILL